MAERRIPPPDVVDAAVRTLRQRVSEPATPPNGTGRVESHSERRLLYIALALLGLAAAAGIAAAIFIGWQAADDRAEARAVDARALAEQRCRAEYAEAQRTAEARLSLAEREVVAARTNIELFLVAQITGEGTPADGAALQQAYTDAIAGTDDELVAFRHATLEGDGASAACVVDPSIRPTPPPGG